MHELLHAKEMFEVFKVGVERNALKEATRFIYGVEAGRWELEVGRVNGLVKTRQIYTEIGEKTRDRFLSYLKQNAPQLTARSDVRAGVIVEEAVAPFRITGIDIAAVAVAGGTLAVGALAFIAGIVIATPALTITGVVFSFLALAAGGSYTIYRLLNFQVAPAASFVEPVTEALSRSGILDFVRAPVNPPTVMSYETATRGMYRPVHSNEAKSWLFSNPSM